MVLSGGHMIDIKNIKKNVWYKESLKLIAILTMLETTAVFLIRGFWYFYKLGFYKAIGVNEIYIEVNTMSSLYEVIGYMGIAALLIVSNYFVYVLLIRKKIIFFLLFCVIQTICLLGIVLESSNIQITSVIKEMLLLNQEMEYFKLIIKSFFLILVINTGGIYSTIANSILYNKGKNKKLSNTDEENIQDIKKIKVNNDILNWIIGFFIILLIEGGYIFGIGMRSGNQKTDYKLIYEQVDIKDIENIHSPYFFTYNNKLFKEYAVLFEDKDNYVIAYLYKEDGYRKIDKNRQKIISKINVETIYSENIFKEGNTNKENQVIEAEQNNDEKEMGKSMADGLVGAIIGALIGGFITWFSTERAIKKQKQETERNAASNLYYDLKSIENYFSYDISVNLRYSDKWQDMVSNCTFLNDEEIKFAYEIYDEVYNFNYFFENNKTNMLEITQQGKKLKEKIGIDHEYSMNEGDCLKAEKNYTNVYSSLLNKLSKYKDK
jgi:hypothetical protein